MIADIPTVEPTGANEEGASKDYEVVIGWRALTYTEGEGQEPIKLYIDPPGRYGQPFAFYIPGEERWRMVMPAWAIGRRDEIVARIKEECSHYHAEWVEG